MISLVSWAGCWWSSMMKRYLLPITMALSLAGCMPGAPSGKMAAGPVEFKDLVGWGQDDHVKLVSMVRAECQRMARLPAETFLGGTYSLPHGRRVRDWKGVCASVPNDRIKEADARRFFEAWFQPYQVVDQAFYTGYYDPEVEASLTRGGAYQTPVYQRPTDLLRGSDEDGELVFGRWVNSVFRPYDDRATIDSGSLEGKGLEIAWLKSPVDLLFLQTQGSGRLRLKGGRHVFVGYDGRNGHPYVPIGRVLIKRGYMKPEDVNAESIRAWLMAHPDQVQTVLEENPSYVFFRIVERSEQEGPLGAFGLPLTPWRSMAIDKRLVGYGLPIWVDTVMNNALGQSFNFQHTVFAQDTGSDVRGAGRGDLFVGWGRDAQLIAGNLKSHGKMVLFIPRPMAVPVGEDIAVSQPVGHTGK